MARAKITGLPHTSEREPGRTAYNADGCRCDECREANSAYHRRGSDRHQPHAPKSETEEWKADGACLTPAARGVEFFPGQGDPTDPAKRICAGCTVRRECLTYALTTPREKYGIWGGTSGADRRDLTLAKIAGKPLPPIRYTDRGTFAPAPPRRTVGLVAGGAR